MSIASFLNRAFWIEDEDVRKAVGPLPQRDAINQARLSAVALEQDRRQLREDLMRQRRELIEQRERVECAIDELDALRVLETGT